MLLIAIAPDGRSELTIELLLLFRRQQRANLIVSLKDELLMPAAKILVQLIHLNPRIAHQRFDLMELVRVQVEFVIEPLDEAMRPGHSH